MQLNEGTIELDQSVIGRAHSEEFRRYFHTFHDDSEIAAHVAYYMIVNKTGLAEIEGFSMPGELAKIVKYPKDCDHFEFRAKEVL